MGSSDQVVDAVKRAREVLDEANSSVQTASIQALRDNSFAARKAETILSEALTSFPMHPYLLAWRANARFRIAYARMKVSSDELKLASTDEAMSDLLAAIEGAPDYFEPRIDLAYHTLNYLDEPSAAAEQFRFITERLQKRLIDCAAGLVEALMETDPMLGQAELRRWRSMFRDSERLRALESER